MGRVTRAAPYLSIDELRTKLHADTNPVHRRHWLILSNALGDPRPADVIARHLGISTALVHKVVSLYNRFGPTVIETPRKGGRYHSYLTLEGEIQLLALRRNRASAGELPPRGEIQRAFEEQVGHPIQKTTISRFLQRHAWRKVVPRPRPPAASPAVQEDVKKKLRCSSPSRGAHPSTRGHATALTKGSR